MRGEAAMRHLIHNISMNHAVSGRIDLVNMIVDAVRAAGTQRLRLYLRQGSGALARMSAAFKRGQLLALQTLGLWLERSNLSLMCSGLAGPGWCGHPARPNVSLAFRNIG